MVRVQCCNQEDLNETPLGKILVAPLNDAGIDIYCHEYKNSSERIDVGLLVSIDPKLISRIPLVETNGKQYKIQSRHRMGTREEG